VRLGEALCFGEFLNFEPGGFPQFDCLIDIKNSFSASITNMNMDRFVVITVEEKLVSVLFEDDWREYKSTLFGGLCNWYVSQSNPESSSKSCGVIDYDCDLDFDETKKAVPRGTAFGNRGAVRGRTCATLERAPRATPLRLLELLRVGPDIPIGRWGFARDSEPYLLTPL